MGVIISGAKNLEGVGPLGASDLAKIQPRILRRSAPQEDRSSEPKLTDPGPMRGPARR